VAVACGLGQVRTARSLDPRAAVVEGRRNPPNQAGSGRSCGEDTRLNHSTAEKKSSAACNVRMRAARAGDEAADHHDHGTQKPQTQHPMKTLSKLLSGAALALVLSSCGSTEPYPGLVARPLPFPPPRIGPDYTRLDDLPGLGGIDRSIFTPRPTPGYTRLGSMAGLGGVDRSVFAPRPAPATRLSPAAARVIAPSSALGSRLTGPTIPPFPRFPRL